MNSYVRKWCIKKLPAQQAKTIWVFIAKRYLSGVKASFSLSALPAMWHFGPRGSLAHSHMSGTQEVDGDRAKRDPGKYDTEMSRTSWLKRSKSANSGTEAKLWRKSRHYEALKIERLNSDWSHQAVRKRLNTRVKLDNLVSTCRCWRLFASPNCDVNNVVLLHIPDTLEDTHFLFLGFAVV